MNPNVQAALTATKKKGHSKPKGNNASSTALDSSAMKSGQPSLGDKPAAIGDVYHTVCILLLQPFIKYFLAMN